MESSVVGFALHNVNLYDICSLLRLTGSRLPEVGCRARYDFRVVASPQWLPNS